MIYSNPSAWAISCKKIINPAKKSGCGKIFIFLFLTLVLLISLMGEVFNKRTCLLLRVVIDRN